MKTKLLVTIIVLTVFAFGAVSQNVNNDRGKIKKELKEEKKQMEKQVARQGDEIEKKESGAKIQREEKREMERDKKQYERETEEIGEHIKKEHEKLDRKADRELKKQEGHEYGKHKEGMSGREFGHKRSQEAKMKHDENVKALHHSKAEAQRKVEEARQKIDASKERLEKDRKEKKIDDTEYNERKGKIEKAEHAVNDLQKKIDSDNNKSEEPITGE